MSYNPECRQSLDSILFAVSCTTHFFLIHCGSGWSADIFCDIRWAITMQICVIYDYMLLRKRHILSTGVNGNRTREPTLSTDWYFSRIIHKHMTTVMIKCFFGTPEKSCGPCRGAWHYVKNIGLSPFRKRNSTFSKRLTYFRNRLEQRSTSWSALYTSYRPWWKYFAVPKNVPPPMNLMNTFPNEKWETTILSKNTSYVFERAERFFETPVQSSAFAARTRLKLCRLLSVPFD